MSEDSSIELRKKIMSNQDKLNDLRRELNIISAEKYNITNINYEEIKKNLLYNLGITLRYLLFFLFIFIFVNLILIYKNIIKYRKIILLIILFIIILIGMLFYRNYKLNSIDQYINNLEKNNKNKLTLLLSKEKNINQDILDIKIDTTNLYNLLKFLSNTT